MHNKKPKMQLENQREHLEIQPKELWYQIIQYTSMTLHGRFHPLLAITLKEPRACSLQILILLQWTDRTMLVVHVSGIDLWKKEKSCLRRALTQKMIHSSKRLNAKYSKLRWKGKSQNQVRQPSTRESQPSDNSKTIYLILQNLLFTIISFLI